MKKMVMTAFLGLAGVSYAQSTALPTLSPVYQKYISAFGDSRPDWSQVAAFLSRVGDRMTEEDEAVDRASRAYVCAVLLKNIVETSAAQDLSGKVVEVGPFKGSYPQAQKFCETKFSEEYNKLVEVQFAPDKVAYIASNYLVIEDERNPKVDQQVNRFKDGLLQRGDIDTRLFYGTLAVDLYLTKYPELREQRFQRGSVVVGKGSDALNNSLQALTQEAALIANYNKKNVQDAQAANSATEQKTLTDLKNLYVKVLGWQAAAEQFTKQKKYQEAWQAYILISTQDQALKFITNDLKSQNNNKTIDVNGKKITANEAVTTINKLISTSMQKASGADAAKQKAQQALAAQWKQAAKATLKGDRLTIFNRFGIPNVLLPGDMYTGDEDIKRSMANIQKATGWQYSFSQTALGGFFCNIKVTFSGNKATSRNISASVVGSDADAYCKSNYRF